MKLEYKCEYCNEIFTSSKKIYKHKHLIHNIKNGQQPKYNLKCTYCEYSKYTTKSGMTVHEKYCKLNPNRIECIGHPVSDETKKKLSNSMHKAAIEGRNKGWTTTTCGPKKKSYPEEFFTKIIENEFNDKNYLYNIPFYTWKLDFAWPHKKLCIEIDGSQHQRDEKQKESDLRKDKKLIECGWKVLRIKWIDIFHNTQEYINQAKEFIDNGIILTCEPYINPIKIKKETNKKKKSKKEKIKKESKYLKDKTGGYNSNVLSIEIWEQRKNNIFNCGIDLQKFGWIEKVIEKTGYTKRIIENTIKRFQKDFDGKYFRKNRK